MKIFSTVTVAGLLLGAGALMHTSIALAAPTCAVCSTWLTECQQGNQTYCTMHEDLCTGCPPRSTVEGAPPTQSNYKSDLALLNAKRTVLITK